jgi:hypothetical protein
VESGVPSVGKIGECDVKSRHLQGCSPRLCYRGVGTREQVLNVLITCQRYGSSKPNSLPSTESGFTPIASMAILGEKLGTDPWIGQPTCCELYRELFFLGAVALSIAVDNFMKGCYALTA